MNGRSAEISAFFARLIFVSFMKIPQLERNQNGPDKNSMALIATL